MPIINTKTYKRFQQLGARVEYRGPDHSDLDDDILVVSSTDPQRNRTSFGNRRSYVTMARGVTTPVRGATGLTEQQNCSFKVQGSVPVGATEAEILAVAADIAAKFADPIFVKDVFILGRIDL